ncbi:DEKNAAC102114 [Brettanomyces naardenensis]|uniref:DEKNAAC102114 n=1 Tax=Brettanomyces naardenensis TaxID=13370 RepID=A0A448YJV5_BRENA|nr:DEKNAAC102114 [Brettanomyces naardenensis]
MSTKQFVDAVSDKHEKAADVAVEVTNVTGTGDEGSEGKDPTSNDFFLSQLKELTDSIATSFDSISNAMVDLRVKAGTLAGLTASLIGESPEAAAAATKTFADKDIDGRLMLLEVAQQEESGLPKPPSATGSTEGELNNATAAAAAAAAAVVFPTYRRPIHLTGSNASASVPEIDLNPRAKSVYDIWDEWMNGYRNQKPLQYLEARYGTKWRRGRIAKSAQRRKKVIEFIESESKRFPDKKPEDVVAALEEYRRRKNKGLFWLYGSLPPRLFSENGDLVVVGAEVEEDGGEPLRKKAKKNDEDEVAEATAAAAVAAQKPNDDTTDPALTKIDN